MMNRYFLGAKAALSLLIAYYLPAFIPFIIAYWAGVAFLFWRGRRGLPLPGEPRLALEYLGGYPGLKPPQRLWLTTGRKGLSSGGLRVPYEAMRRVRVLGAEEGLEVARSEGLALPSAGAGDLFLAVLWRSGAGEERELVFRLPEGAGEAALRRLKERIEALREGRRKRP
jgi:hypothetical protein